MGWKEVGEEGKGCGSEVTWLLHDCQLNKGWGHHL